MLRRTPGLSRPVLRWVSQVTASLGATLSATLIWSAVPHPGAATTAQQPGPPELTSGGKYAARAVEPAAYDGLDTMPLPRVAHAIAPAIPSAIAPSPVRFVLASLDAVSLDAASPRAMRRVSADEATAPATAPSVERRAARPARQPVRVEPRRAEPALSASPSPARTDAPTTEQAEATVDQGFLRRVLPSSLQASLPAIGPGIAATAREAWSVTASAGDALVAHIVPRMP